MGLATGKRQLRSGAHCSPHRGLGERALAVEMSAKQACVAVILQLRPKSRRHARGVPQSLAGFYGDAQTVPYQDVKYS